MQPWFTVYFFDIAHPCYNQLTPVKAGYPLTSITWPYRRLKCTAHRGHVFFWSWLLTKCWFSIGSRAHVRLTCWKQGKIVRKPVNTSPGLKFIPIIIIITFSSVQMFLLPCPQAAQAQNTRSYILFFYFYANIQRNVACDIYYYLTRETWLSPCSILGCCVTTIGRFEFIKVCMGTQRFSWTSQFCLYFVNKIYLYCCSVEVLLFASSSGRSNAISPSYRLVGFHCYKKKDKASHWFPECASAHVFLLAVKTHRAIPCRNRLRSTWGVGKQQKTQYSNRVSRFYSQNKSKIDFSSKTVAFPYKPAFLIV